MYCGRAANGRHYQKSVLAVPALSINTSWSGSAPECLFAFGGRGLPNTTTWKGLNGSGKASMEPWSRLHWPRRPSEETQQIGEKKGTKRSLLVDANGIPLSIVVSGANTHDVKLLEPTLDQIVIERPKPEETSPQNLCADKGYAGKGAKAAIEARNYIPHVVPRDQEAKAKKRNSEYKARRWVVERTHSWLNRFRKLLVRFEKLADSHQGLLELACALIAFRQTISIYG